MDSETIVKQLCDLFNTLPVNLVQKLTLLKYKHDSITTSMKFLAEHRIKENNIEVKNDK